MRDATWGDTVLVQRGAVSSDRLGTIAEIVGLREIENSAQAEQFSMPIGTKIYLIEFGDGEGEEVPENWIEVVST